MNTKSKSKRRYRFKIGDEVFYLINSIAKKRGVIVGRGILYDGVGTNLRETELNYYVVRLSSSAIFIIDNEVGKTFYVNAPEFALTEV